MRKNSGITRDADLRVRIDAQERSLLRAAASRSGESLSDFVRRTTLAVAREVVDGE